MFDLGDIRRARSFPHQHPVQPSNSSKSLCPIPSRPHLRCTESGPPYVIETPLLERPLRSHITSYFYINLLFYSAIEPWPLTAGQTKRRIGKSHFRVATGPCRAAPDRSQRNADRVRLLECTYDQADSLAPCAANARATIPRATAHRKIIAIHRTYKVLTSCWSIRSVSRRPP